MKFTLEGDQTDFQAIVNKEAELQFLRLFASRGQHPHDLPINLNAFITGQGFSTALPPSATPQPLPVTQVAPQPLPVTQVAPQHQPLPQLPPSPTPLPEPIPDQSNLPVVRWNKKATNALVGAATFGSVVVLTHLWMPALFNNAGAWLRNHAEETEIVTPTPSEEQQTDTDYESRLREALENGIVGESEQ